MAFCPSCGSVGKFDDHVDNGFGDTGSMYECETCEKWFYVKDEETMFQRITRLCQSREGILSLSKEHLFYASEWVTAGDLEIPEDLMGLFSEECVMNLE